MLSFPSLMTKRRSSSEHGSFGTDYYKYSVIFSTRALYGVHMVLGYVFQDGITDEKRYVATISDTREKRLFASDLGSEADTMRSLYL